MREAIERAKEAGMSTARWRMPEHDVAVGGGSPSAPPTRSRPPSEKARTELATKDRPLSDD